MNPGEKGRITVTTDTKGKLGKIAKSIRVHSNDTNRPQITLVLMMNIRDELHSRKYNAREIFRKPCAGCHVDAGKYNRGFDLFNSDCAMCHNYNKTAAPAAAMRDIPEDRLRKNIEDGVNGSSMPSWSETKGGPLTSEEIRSLVEFIKGKK